MTLARSTISRHSLALVALAAAAIACSGCAREPFSVNGIYHGEWHGTLLAGTGTGIYVDCPLTLQLDDSPGLLYRILGYNIIGVASFDYTCFLPDFIAEMIDYNSLDIPIFGKLERNGALKMQSGACISDEIVCITLELDGEGSNTDDDARMDRYAGFLDLHIAIQNIPNLDFEATFEVFHNEDPNTSR